MSTEIKTVFVGLSGGVDSSVAALRLKQQGYQVVGVFIKVWQPDFLKCNWEKERLDAMRVAAYLDIPFLTCNAEEAYRQEVGEYFVSEYQAGRTPNPDVMCNQYVKFGAFLQFALERGADYIATGHYAQKIETDKGFSLYRGVDSDKDQSYFLWTLTQEQLKHVLLPVGDTAKTKIRAEAEAAGIPVAQKKDSQGICFLGAVDIPEFLSHFVELTPGSVLNERGEVIGEHKGALVHTIGQRHGFSVKTDSTKEVPHFVIAKDVEANTLTVSATPPTLKSDTEIKLTDLNWITEPDANKPIEAQFRYRQKPFVVSIERNDSGVILTPKENVETPAGGQSCVLYQGDHCLGGGIIS